MGHRLAALIVASSCVLASGCAHRSARATILPPRFDLQQFERIGLIPFDSSVDGELAALTSRRFAELARRDQARVQLIDLGPAELAGPVNERRNWDPETIRAIGRERGVRTVLIGALRSSEAAPDVVLDVRLVDTATGAAIWRRTAQAPRSDGAASEVDRQLVDTLATEVTRDFRVTWEQSFYY